MHRPESERLKMLENRTRINKKRIRILEDEVKSLRGELLISWIIIGICVLIYISS